MPRDEATLLDILGAARLALEFKGSVDKETLWTNRQLQASILYQLVIIGEGVRRLSMEFRDAHGEIPWREIAGMRDHLVHAYDAVDLDEVWTTLERDVPALIDWLENRGS
jgi:uncharacterized protein with HEPN domain